MLSGNLECRSRTIYGFKEEIEAVWTSTVYDSFDHRPMTTILNDHFFCVHAGRSHQLQLRQDIFAIAKTQEDPVTGIAGDLFWTDFEEGVENYEVDVATGCNGDEWPFEPTEGCLTMFTAVDYLG
jgi:hypothetical protein